MRAGDAAALLTLAAGCVDFDRALVVCMENGGCAEPRTLRVAFDAGRTDGGVPQAFPLRVPLGPALVAGVVNPATDLRFTDADGTVLPFEVVAWDAGGGSTAWVRVPSLQPPTVLRLFTGPSARGQADPAAVWAGYEVVHHFEPGLSSSAGGGYEAAFVGVDPRGGVVGESPWFDGAGDERVTFAGGAALFDGWAQFTLAFWLYADYPSTAAVVGEPAFLDQGGGLNNGRLLSPGGGDRFQVDMHFTGNNDTYLGAGYPVRRWTFIVYTFDGLRLRLFVDGVEVGSDAMRGGPQTMSRSNFEFFLGHRNAAMRGSIDELWVEKRARDAVWVKALFQSVEGGLVTIGPPP